MNKLLEGLVFFIIIILCLLLVFSAVYLDFETRDKLKDFCESNGFNYSEVAILRVEESKCIKVKDNIRFESIVDKCGKNWCFVNSEVKE